ncbi:hypothetical protein QBC40DRAFT_251288 [Triangularia verruculosa]|uniref:Uncharacterized protein n=1 Tax=Triangularia verruculosa TaxID=2587418 RepID=A0AAN7AY70_9PEZI|nr:hypothetical protein QBC40DRAFT_251288 [Triangularia verruculosa]
MAGPKSNNPATDAEPGNSANGTNTKTTVQDAADLPSYEVSEKIAGLAGLTRHLSPPHLQQIVVAAALHFPKIEWLLLEAVTPRFCGEPVTPYTYDLAIIRRGFKALPTNRIPQAEAMLGGMIKTLFDAIDQSVSTESPYESKAIAARAMMRAFFHLIQVDEETLRKIYPHLEGSGSTLKTILRRFGGQLGRFLNDGDGRFHIQMRVLWANSDRDRFKFKDFHKDIDAACRFVEKRLGNWRY